MTQPRGCTPHFLALHQKVGDEMGSSKHRPPGDFQNPFRGKITAATHARRDKLVAKQPFRLEQLQGQQWVTLSGFENEAAARRAAKSRTAVRVVDKAGNPLPDLNVIEKPREI